MRYGYVWFVFIKLVTPPANMVMSCLTKSHDVRMASFSAAFWFEPNVVQRVRWEEWSTWGNGWAQQPALICKFVQASSSNILRSYASKGQANMQHLWTLSWLKQSAAKDSFWIELWSTVLTHDSEPSAMTISSKACPNTTATGFLWYSYGFHIWCHCRFPNSETQCEGVVGSPNWTTHSLRDKS